MAARAQSGKAHGKGAAKVKKGVIAATVAKAKVKASKVKTKVSAKKKAPGKDEGPALSVGRMLKNVKEKLASLREPGAAKPNPAVASVVDLAKRREAKKAEKNGLRTKAPTLKQDLKGSHPAGGFTKTAANAKLKGATNTAGRRGHPDQIPRDQVGNRNH